MAVSRIGYDVLLAERVEQLKLIDERLEGLAWKFKNHDSAWLERELRGLRIELADMIRKAEQDSADF